MKVLKEWFITILFFYILIYQFKYFLIFTVSMLTILLFVYKKVEEFFNTTYFEILKEKKDPYYKLTDEDFDIIIKQLYPYNLVFRYFANTMIRSIENKLSKDNEKEKKEAQKEAHAYAQREAQKRANERYKQAQRIIRESALLTQKHYDYLSFMKFVKVTEIQIKPGLLDKNLLKKRYRELAKLYHPDTNNGSDELFKKLNEAYTELKKISK